MAVPTIALNAADEGTTLRAMPGAVIYVRVSTKEQTENLSLPTQLRACEDYCRREGLDVLARFDNDVRSDRTRAGMKAALEIGRRVFLVPIGYVNAARSAGRSLLQDPERAEHSQGVRRLRDGPLQQAADARTRDGRRLAESTQPATQFAGHRYAAAQSSLRRHHRRPRVRRAPRAWRPRGDHHRRPVPACPGRAVRPHPEQRAAAAGASGLPAPQLRALR
ncbi:MAG: recombinase family protein, partial [Chloroflexi bacterium]|nr:recombinase family protein [Chloroflexota bacterium]